MDTTQSNMVMRLTEQQGAIVICEQGLLWLTDNGDDIVLARGERHRILSMAPVVVESLSTDGRFRLEGTRAPQTHWRQKLQHALHNMLHHKPLPHAHA